MDEQSYLKNAANWELQDELARRRQSALQHCATEDIEAELAGRGIDPKAVRPHLRNDKPPKYVEK